MFKRIQEPDVDADAWRPAAEAPPDTGQPDGYPGPLLPPDIDQLLLAVQRLGNGPHHVCSCVCVCLQLLKMQLELL